MPKVVSCQLCLDGHLKTVIRPCGKAFTLIESIIQRLLSNLEGRTNPEQHLFGPTDVATDENRGVLATKAQVIVLRLLAQSSAGNPCASVWGSAAHNIHLAVLFRAKLVLSLVLTC